MYLASPEPIDVFLQPGDFYFGEAGTRIRTLLGSCVAITLWHPILHIGGMCHIMLPERGERSHRDRKSTRLNSSHIQKSRMPSSA